MQITGSTLLLLLLSCFSRARLLVTPWTEAYQAPPSMGLSSQEYWNGVPLPSLKLIHRQTVNKLQNVNYKEVF